MSQTSIAGQSVEQCGTCGGCWFDALELSAAMNATELDARSSNPAGDAPIEINCPRCKTNVAYSTYAYDSGIPINRCPACHGVWLQQGQLQRLVNYRLSSPELNASVNSIADDFATMGGWVRGSELAKSRVLSSAVAAAILMIVFVVTRRFDVVLRLLTFLLLPMVCIWFPDAMGNLTGISLGIARPRITGKKPGWILLATVVFAVIYQLI
jgi:Zn-finger nucleic acid-binding protein